MGLRSHLEVLRRHVAALVVSLVVFPGLALGLSLLATPTYTSTAELFVSLENSTTASDLAQGANYTREQMASYATLVTTPAVLQPVVDELGLAESARALGRRVTATAPNDTVVLQISATDPSPVVAARIAQAVSEQLVEVMDDVAPTNADGRATVRVTQVTPAAVPLYASSPNTVRNVAVGVLLGLAVGVLYAVLRENLDTRVRDVGRLESLTDAPLLGSIAAAPATRTGVVPVADEPRGTQAEMFRQLATNVEFLRVAGGPTSLLVTSALPGEGKSTVAMNLALALAEVGHRVVLVDADLRRPTVADRLDLEGGAGLSTVLLGRADVDDVLQEWGAHGLHVLTSGAVPPNPVQLLSSARMTALMAELGAHHDVVVVDAAPVLPVTDALVLARAVSGVVVVADSSSVRRAQLAETLESLVRVDARLSGVVLNKLPARSQLASHGYGYGAPVPEPSRWRRVVDRVRRRPAGRRPAPAPGVPGVGTAGPRIPAARRASTAGGRPGVAQGAAAGATRPGGGAQLLDRTHR